MWTLLKASASLKTLCRASQYTLCCVFKITLLMRSKKNQHTLTSEKTGKISTTLGCGIGRSRVPKTTNNTKGATLPHSKVCPSFRILLRVHPRPPGHSNSWWEAAGDVAAPESSSAQNAASGYPVLDFSMEHLGMCLDKRYCGE